MKRILSVILTLCLVANISFAAFDPYADEEVEKKSYKKLYYGIALTLLGGFLAYDGFSKEEVNVSKPRVDALTVSHSEWVQNPGGRPVYQIRSGISINNVLEADYEHYLYDEDRPPYVVELNKLYNNGNVDLKNVTIEVAYKFDDGTYIGANGEHVKGEYYYNEEKERVSVFHTVTLVNEEGTGPAENIGIKKGEYVTWKDVWEYPSEGTDQPNNTPRQPYVEGGQGQQANPGLTGLNLGKHSVKLMLVRVKLNKNQQYKPIYEKRNKCDAEGVAGILVGLAGIYFIVDHFLDMHKFNAYAKRHHLNLRLATASNEYKLMLQKRL